MCKPLQIQVPHPQNRNAKNAPLNRHSEYKPPGGLCLEFSFKYKGKTFSKNGKFPSHYKLAQSILKRKFRSVDKSLRI